jgi:hypothetical protein
MSYGVQCGVWTLEELICNLGCILLNVDEMMAFISKGKLRTSCNISRQRNG